jgi:hypothetical protein
MWWHASSEQCHTICFAGILDMLLTARGKPPTVHHIRGDPTSSEGIFAVPSLLFATEPDAASDTLIARGFDERYPVAVSACRETTSALDVERQETAWGKVDVPENHYTPDGQPLACSGRLFAWWHWMRCVEV